MFIRGWGAEFGEYQQDPNFVRWIYLANHIANLPDRYRRILVELITVFEELRDEAEKAPVSFGERLKQIRIARKIQQMQLARMTDIPLERIVEFEKDMKTPTTPEFLAILNVLGITTDQFFSMRPVHVEVGITEAERQRIQQTIREGGEIVIPLRDVEVVNDDDIPDIE